MKRAVHFAALVVVLAVGSLSLAHADGPGGSSEHRQACIDGSGQEQPRNADGSCPEGSSDTTVYENDVTCGSNQDVGGFDVFVGPSGFEVCNDGGAAGAPQGRVMAAGDPASQSGYVGADGDKDNGPGPPAGWAGVSSEAGTPVACDDDSANRDLSHATSSDDITGCLPPEEADTAA